MNVSDAIKARRSIRKYSQKPVEDEKINAVIEVARLAPSANNMQAWKFIVVKDKQKIAQLQKACGNQGFVGTAPVVLVACALSNRVMTCGQPTEAVDTSIAMSFIILEACEQGLGTCWLGNFHEDKVKEILGIPGGTTVVAVTPLGYPDEQPDARPRKPVQEVVSFDKF